MVVISKDGVANGQELVQCYNSDVMFIPLDVRRQQLMASWNFLCTCDRCQADEAKGSNRALGVCSVERSQISPASGSTHELAEFDRKCGVQAKVITLAQQVRFASADCLGMYVRDE